MNKNVYSVGQVNLYIKRMMAGDFFLKNLSVKGEISNCKYHSSGHIYFSLKDETGTMSAVMFAGNRRTGLDFPMKDGDCVIITGSVEVYERDGKYQIYAKKIERDGEGNLYVKYEQLKKELEEMGMFALEYKKSIPRFVQKVGVVTAPTGAAVQDIRNIARRRNPYVQLILYPALVQGEGAVQSIVTGIEVLDQMGLDVLIVGRGGGSIEDLWAFNEEAVVRAIFECQTPIISAVGHETDTTLSDYAADLRAPTPSAAAELAVFEYAQFMRELDNYAYAFKKAMNRKIQNAQQKNDYLVERLQRLSPQNQLNTKKMIAADLRQQLQNRYQIMLQKRIHQLSIYKEQLAPLGKQLLEKKKHRMLYLAGQLEGRSPVKKLTQGFGFVAKEDGKGIQQIDQVACGETIQIHLWDGIMDATVTQKKQIRRSEDGREYR